MTEYESEYEFARASLDRLVKWYNENKGGRNEATTRLHVIDTLFFDCLRWKKEDVISEDSHNGEYADYTFLAPRRIMIVEAKKEGNYFEVPIDKEKSIYSIQGLIRDNPKLGYALEQVAGYCQSRGVPFGVVCNGHQIVAFIATRSDGLPPLEGRALVYSSLEQMQSNFINFWNNLSSKGIQSRKMMEQLTGTPTIVLPPRLSSTLDYYPGHKGRNVFQADLKNVSELIIEDLASQRKSIALETRFLQECYCKSGALSRYSLMTKNILEARYASLFDGGNPGPTISPAVAKEGISPELLAESLSRRPILLIGDVGVGKTTFIRHLIRVEAPEIFKNAYSLYLDMGSTATLTSDLKQFVINEVKRQLQDEHAINIDEDSFVRAVYDLDLKSFRKGIFAPLIDIDPRQFLVEEIKYLAHKISDHSEYLKRAIGHIVKGRKKQIIVFLDNVDQRDEQTQQDAFLIAQEIAENWDVVVFVTLRPETFHNSAKRGALTGYHAKAFTISPPRLDLVISKRLDFALKFTSGEIQFPALPGRVHLSSLDTVIRSFIHSLNHNDDLKELLENICGGNVRLALDLVRGFFGSGHVDTKKIVDICNEEGLYVIPLHEFLRAVIYGDYEYYDPDVSIIANLWDIVTADPKEHFLLILILHYLSGFLSGGQTTEEGFVEIRSVYEQLQGIGFTPEQIDGAIVRGIGKKLMISSARRIPQLGQAFSQAIRITSVGLYHLTRLACIFVYNDAMIIDTPIFDTNARSNIHNASTLKERLDRVDIFRLYLESVWKKNKKQFSKLLYDWVPESNNLSIETKRIRTRFIKD